MKKYFILILFFPLFSLSFTEENIVLNGDFSDWVVVLQDPQNVIEDGAKGAGDPDNPSQTSSDLRVFALTWNDSNLYGYFKRGTTSNSGITFLIYLDLDHDGLMKATDRCLFWSFNNSGFQNFNLYSYVPSNPSGDLLQGDGYKMPGTIGTLLSTNGSGAMETTGTRYEVSVSFSVLGIQPKIPLYAKPSLTLGTNIPNQIEDNGDILDTLIQKISIEPERETSAKPGNTVSFLHTIKNLGNSSEIIELEGISLQGWEISFWDENGSNPLSDTNGNGTPDTGILSKGNSKNITVKVKVASSVPTQTNDEITVNVKCASNSSVQDYVLDKIYAGFVVTFKKDQEKWATSPSQVPFYGQKVENLTESGITINVTSSSNQGWTTQVYMDSNCDRNYEGGPISSFYLNGNSSLCLITYIYVPSGISIGTIDITQTKILFGTPLIEIPVYSRTNIEDEFNLAPANSSSQGPGESIFYKHYIRNNQNFNDLFDLQVSSSLGWQTQFLKNDRITPLNDNNGNGKPDTGNLESFGGYFEFYLKVTIPSSATYNMQEISTITGLSFSTNHQRTTQDTTTVKVLVTFEDGAYSIPKNTFPPCSSIFYKAFSLSNGIYRFMVYDSSNVLKTNSPVELSPDQSGQVYDSYNFEPLDPLGTWSVKLQKKSGNGWVDLPNYLAYFDLVNLGTITVQSGREIYNKTNETLTITSNLKNQTNTNFYDTSIYYLVFCDLNSNSSPDNGEPYIRTNGSIGSYTSGSYSHITNPFNINANSTKQDLWSVFISDFVYAGVWKIVAIWKNYCLNIISQSTNLFQVVSDIYPPNSQITNPLSGQNLYISQEPFQIQGTALDNETYVSEVKVSVDNGLTWANAIDDTGNFSSWHFLWSPFYRGNYVLISKAKDAVSNYETELETVNVRVIDDTPPATPSVSDDGSYTRNILHSNWSSEDPNSGILYYEYCIGTSSSTCDLVPFTNAGLSTEITRNDLNLINGTTYYFRVRATNLDSYISSIGISNGITCDKLPPSSTITDPIANSTITGKNYIISGNTNDNLSGINYVEISTDGGNNYNLLSGTSNWSYSWTLPEDGNYCLKVRGMDNVSNLEVPSCHWVYVNSYPYPPSNFEGTETGFCQAKLSWEESPSKDVKYYNIYSDQGTGTINYTTPIKKVPSPQKNWTTLRGIYGYCGTQISLTKEGEYYNQVHFEGINTNKSSYLISGIRVSWDILGPDIRVDKIYINSNLVFQANPGAPTNNGEILSLNPVNIPAGSTFTAQIDFKYVSGSDPDMLNKEINIKFSGGGWSPYLSLLLKLSGAYPIPCENNNLGSMEPAVPYKFAIRAEDSIGQEEDNTNITISITVCNSSSVQVQIKSPFSGSKIEGREVTVYGEISKGSVEDLQEVTFQYKSNSGVWTNMVSSHNYFGNPDTEEPFFIYWDVTSLPEGIYYVRAVAKDKLGILDLFPYELSIQINHTSYNLLEDTNGAGLHELTQLIVPSSENNLTQGENFDNFITYAKIYSNTLTIQTNSHLILEDPLIKQSLVPINWQDAREFRTLTLESGENPSSPFLIKLYLNDYDKNNIVDSTTVYEWDLIMYRYDGGNWYWLPTEINLTNDEVKGYSTSFGLFAPLKAPYESDPFPPKEVYNLKLQKNGSEIIHKWDPVIEDINGNPENIHHYNIYRGTIPSFVPDKINRINLFGISSLNSFTDSTSLKDNNNYYYLITAVDMGGNEGQ